jgi:glycosyltransferase involved in cell wall biosynthesis|uniref:Glycosyltransferase family 1 protein n=1 Tax=Desulfobacca acetoxidans TaxID=60893 RepID=A0A7V6A655_9BACT
MVKIAHVVTTLYETNATGWVTALAEDQINRGCQVDLVVGRNASPRLIAEKRSQGFGVIQIPTLRKYVRPVHEIHALMNLYRLFRAERYDVVHTHLAKAGVIGRLAAHMAGIPRVIHSVYGATFAPTQAWARRVLFRDLERLAGRATDAFIFVGKELQEAYCRAGICPPERGQVIYYGKDLFPFLALAGLSRKERLGRRQALGLREKDLVLGNVSRLVPWKGHDYAIDVVGALKESFPNLKLIIVGDAKTPSEIGFKKRLRKKVQRLGLEEDIIFTGWVKDPARYFAAFDLYLLTSMPLEGVPGAVIEAALAGVPVVGFDCFGVREIPGVQATLVPPKDIQALINVLREKLRHLANGQIHISDNQNPAVQTRMCQQFDMGRMVRETWNVYQHSLGH